MTIRVGYLLPTREGIMEGRHEALPIVGLAERAGGLLRRRQSDQRPGLRAYASQAGDRAELPLVSRLWVALML